MSFSRRWSRRLPLHVLSVVALVVLTTAAQGRVVSRFAAQNAGLERAWFTQVAIEPSTQTVADAALLEGVLYVLNSGGGLQALDAETGVTVWKTRLGDPQQPAYGPALHRVVKEGGGGRETVTTRCAMISGSTLFVLDATNGAELFRKRLPGAPASAPVLGDSRVFVALAGGRLVGFPYDQGNAVNFTVASPGQQYSQPQFAAGRVVWTTSVGEVYGAVAATGSPAFRFHASAPVVGTPAASDGSLYFASESGIVYALTAKRARPVWRASIGVAIEKPAVAAGGGVYVVSEAPTLHAFDAETGEQSWSVEGLDEFVAASAERVYAITPRGELGVLDRASGRPLASWPAAGALRPVANTENDRLYFVSDAGLVQCFHEEGLDTPHWHDGRSDQPAIDEAEAPADGADEAAPAEDDQPPADFMEDEPADEPAGDDPFDPFAPAGDAAAGDDPFAPADEAASDDPFADF